MQKKNFLTFIGIIIISSIIIYLIAANIYLRNLLQNMDNAKKEEFQKKLNTEKEKIKKGLEEKHRADMVSYEAMKRQLENEKTKEIQKIEEYKKR